MPSLYRTELATRPDCRRQKISKPNMFIFCSYVQSRKAAWAGIVCKRVHTADRTGQNCSVSNILRTTENYLILSPTVFTPPTRQDKTRESCLVRVRVWTRHSNSSSPVSVRRANPWIHVWLFLACVPAGSCILLYRLSAVLLWKAVLDVPCNLQRVVIIL